MDLLQGAFWGFVNDLRVAYINICSLLGSIELIEFLLASSYVEMVLVTEAWFKPIVPNSAIEIKGFKSLRMDREVSSRKSGGSVIIY